jgi:protein ImuB
MRTEQHGQACRNIQLFKLQNLGLHRVGSLMDMPSSVLRRRFGRDMVLRLHQALGREPEYLCPLKELLPYVEKPSCREDTHSGN